MNITTNEILVIKAILESEYQDANNPIGNHVWSWSCNPFACRLTYSGVVSSLAQKGLITTGGDGEDATVAITQDAASLLEDLAELDDDPDWPFTREANGTYWGRP